jgi:hypothetical protein
MTKWLTAEQKANELGITTNGLAKTRHLYKYLKKSPRKYLYLEEDPKEAYRPFKAETTDAPVNSRSRRRDVPFGQENYHNCRGGSGEKLKIHNQMKSKLALEGKLSKEECNSLDEALAYSIKKNYKEINQVRKAELLVKLQREDADTRRRIAKAQNPIKNVGGMKYPYTNMAYPTSSSQSWHYQDRRSDERNRDKSWYDDIPKKYTYYG